MFNFLSWSHDRFEKIIGFCAGAITSLVQAGSLANLVSSLQGILLSVLMGFGGALGGWLFKAVINSLKRRKVDS